MSLRIAVLVGLVAAALVLAVVPAKAGHLFPAVEMLPDGHERPVVHSADLLAPEAHNALLEAGLVVDATDDSGVVGYEYRWNSGEVFKTSIANPAVSYETLKPTTLALLQVRAVDDHGFRSDWYGAWSGVTPRAPNVIVAGDSVASGYSRQWFTQESTCVDESYSYGSSLVAGVAASLPAAWAPTYANVAFPGAGVGNVMQGGSDSCSDGYPSQVDSIAELTDPGTWNVVVITAGINSTNWVDVVTELTKDTAFSLFDSGDKKACQSAVAEDWDFDHKASHITSTTAQVVENLSSKTNASLYWTSYYQLAGTKLVGGWSPIGPECEDEMNDALGQLHNAIRAGLTDDVTWVDLGRTDVSLQQWAGWPHPNPEGHAVIGSQIADAIVS